MKLTKNLKTDKLDKTTNMYKPCPLSVFNFFNIFFVKLKSFILPLFQRNFDGIFIDCSTPFPWCAYSTKKYLKIRKKRLMLIEKVLHSTWDCWNISLET